MISNALKTDNNNLQNNPLYSKAKKQILIEKEYKNLYRSVEGLNCLKEKVLTENYVSTQSPKQQNKLGAFSDENRCRKEINVGKKKENNLQKSYDISKNSFKDFLMEHSQDQDNNK
jgi:transposase-like protein